MRFALALSLLCLAPVARASDGDPWIGIEMAPGAHGGVAVKDVGAGAPGEAARIVPGDELLAVDGRKLSNPGEIYRAVRTAKVGGHLKLTILAANGRERAVDVLLTARPAPEAIQRNSLLRRAAPDFAPSVQAGAKFDKLSSLRGQVVLIDFFATWCGPCVEVMPKIERLHQTLAQKGLKVMGVSSEEPEVVAAAAGRFHLSYSLVSDANEVITSRYHVFALPTMVVIYRKGNVREIAISDDEQAERAVRELMAEK